MPAESGKHKNGQHRHHVLISERRRLLLQHHRHAAISLLSAPAGAQSLAAKRGREPLEHLAKRGLPFCMFAER